MKSCYFCKGPLEVRRIDHMARRADAYVLVKDIPAEVCVQCGEVYLDEHASRRIDEALRAATDAEEHLEVPVVHCA